MRVAVVGSGYVGTVTAAALAWLGNRVVGLERDALRTAQLAAGQVPFLEPGLPDLVRDALATTALRFTTDPEDALSDAEVAFICVGTPPGPGGLPDLGQVEQAAHDIARNLTPGLAVANKSTVPVGSGNLVRSLIEEARGGATLPFGVVSNPEFLREGSAVEDFLHPDRIVIGGEEAAGRLLVELYRPILEQSFPGGDPDRRPLLLCTDLESAEMVKYASNAFLATKISFANEIANLCERMGADSRQVLPAIGADRRIGPDFLGAGVGWGGSCLPKDVAALIAMGRERNYRAPLLRGTLEVNRRQRALFLEKLRRELGGLERRRVGILGLAFKPQTDDLREAPATELIQHLLAAGTVVSAHDPAVKVAPPELAEVRMATDPYEAADRADALVLVTEWPEFRGIDLQAVAARMEGELILDGRNVLDPTAAARAGLRLVGMGWAA